MDKTVVMCTPDYFGVIYRINPWMHPDKDQVDKDLALKDWHSLIKTYTGLGIKVHTIKQDKKLPDMVYAANFGFVLNNTFIKSNYKYDQRKAESDHAKQFFQKGGFEIYELPDDVAFEGQGDLLKMGNSYFLGWGKRSDQRAKKFLTEALGSKIIDLELVNPYYYHLDTCFAPLDENTVAINPISFTAEGLKKIYQHFPNVILVGKDDNNILACNLVMVGKTVITGLGITQKFKDDLANYGFSTIEVPMGEFRKGGGSVKCLTLEYFKE
ncbi:N-dimethylarginine dimethylaminohydrolase [Candidatus Daviesbacteria bacterium]|nr:N-dimethylarginine dimethylaminohydrolase [Candidatus Daviesbacteria bacterium]